MTARLSGIRAVAFDAYGTLFDVASPAERLAASLGDRWRAFAELWRAKQLQYTWLRSLAGRHADFFQVTGDALDFALDAVGVRDIALRERLLGLYERLDPYPDARQALARLRASGLRLAILSNGAPNMLESATRSAGLADLLDAILSVEEVRVFKPHPSVYRLAVDRLGVPAESLAFVSSNGWDAFSAQAYGLRVAWCNRAGQPRERIPAAPEAEIRSLAELPDLLGA
ncbi:MAG TPA: haloacid dehalogenase type II [Anaeromyxobacteraceae bacterium]|nr:haloacid dehalogenase type II [Anaeromyxobacteraceae bacterium]